MKRWILWVPFALFVLVGGFAAFMLRQDGDREIRSQMIGKQLPEFDLPGAMPGRTSIKIGDYRRGEPRILNVFASWCGPCKLEAPYLMELARRGVPIDAVAIRDRPEDVARFLAEWGDPFRNIGHDANRSLQLALGSAGVPETFIIDGAGIIRHQHIGEIRAADVDRIVAEYEAARR